MYSTLLAFEGAEGSLYLFVEIATIHFCILYDRHLPFPWECYCQPAVVCYTDPVFIIPKLNGFTPSMQNLSWAIDDLELSYCPIMKSDYLNVIEDLETKKTANKNSYEKVNS